jgi:hypothetical protein
VALSLLRVRESLTPAASDRVLRTQQQVNGGASRYVLCHRTAPRRGGTSLYQRIASLSSLSLSLSLAISLSFC